MMYDFLNLICGFLLFYYGTRNFRNVLVELLVVARLQSSEIRATIYKWEPIYISQLNSCL